MNRLLAIPAVLIAAALGLMAPDGAKAASFTDPAPASVDNSSDTRTITVATSAIPVGQIVTDVNISVDFQKVSGNDCLVPLGGDSYSDEISMSLNSPAGTVVDLV